MRPYQSDLVERLTHCKSGDSSTSSCRARMEADLVKGQCRSRAASCFCGLTSTRKIAVSCRLARAGEKTPVTYTKPPGSSCAALCLIYVPPRWRRLHATEGMYWLPEEVLQNHQSRKRNLRSTHNICPNRTHRPQDMVLAADWEICAFPKFPLSHATLSPESAENRCLEDTH